MSNLAPFNRQQQPGLPTPAKGITIARYTTYGEAQRAVDYLSDEHFPVQAVTIVGVDLQMVERVTGRLTYSRVAIAGMASGAWFGLFVGLLILTFGGATGGSLIAAVIIGAAFGGLFGLISYALTGGRRDFTSTSQIVAGEYRVLCLEEQAGQAMQLLRKLPGGTGKDGPSATAPVVPYGTPPAAPGAPLEPTSGPLAGPVDPAAEASAEPEAPPAPVTGPTYSEMIEKKKQEEREARDRESS